MKPIEQIISDIHHTALALELPEQVYDDYTAWLTQALKDYGDYLIAQMGEEIDDYLLKVTTFSIIGKDNLKNELCELVDKKFEYIEKDLKKANQALADARSNMKKANQ